MPVKSQEELKVRLDEAKALIVKNDFKKAIKELLEILVNTPQAKQNLPMITETHLLLAEAFSFTADFGHSMENVKKATELANLINDERFLVRALCQHGHILLRTSEFDLAEKVLNEGHGIARKLKDPGLEGVLLMEIGNLKYLRGDPEKAEADLREAVLLLQKVDDRMNIARAYNNIASFVHRRGDKERALEFFDKTKVLCEKVGATRYMALAMMNKAGVLVELDRLDEAKKEIDAARVHFEKLGDKFLLAMTYVALGTAHAKKEEWPEAEDYLHRARLMVQKIGMPTTQGVVLFEIGKVWMLKGDRQQALRYFDEAETIFEEHEFKGGLRSLKEFKGEQGL